MLENEREMSEEEDGMRQVETQYESQNRFQVEPLKRGASVRANSQGRELERGTRSSENTHVRDLR